MDSLLELAPVVAFFGTYYFTKDIYTATAVLMVAMALLLAVDYLRTRRIPTLHLVSAVLVFAFGAATLLLHSKQFIQWKPTAFFWLLAVAFLLSNWIGKQPLVQRMLSKSLGTEIQVSPATWRRLNWLWIVFYVAIGALNLFVAFNASESAWVNFKMFGLTGATFVFLALQIAWLMRRAAAAEPPAQA
jgi:intracellular septation protein